MRPRLFSVLATGVLALSLLGPTGAQGDPGEPVAGPSLPEPAAAAAQEHATDALEEAHALFEERPRAEARELLAEGGLDATMALNQLLRVRDDLDPAERARADALLARPTDDGGGQFGDTYTVKEEPPVCGDTVCIHYVATTGDAPDLTDDTGNGVPDTVDQALATAEAVHDTYVAAGYRRPDGDGIKGPGDDLVDVYLSDLGNQALYGYCTTDQKGTTYNRWAYCGIDEDFAEFPGHTPLQNLQVTLAHEYFHAVQFAYDAFEDPWFMEATATWAEDEVYDDVDDNRQYLDEWGQLFAPDVPLDSFEGSHHYANWLFFRYLTERWTEETGSLPKIVLEMWRLAGAREGDRDLYSTQAVQAVLDRRGTGFTPVYGQFVAANRTPARTYAEGADYPTAAPDQTWTLRRGKRGTGLFQVRPLHLSSIPLRYRPGAGTGQSDWRLRLNVDMPAKKTAPVARVLVRRDNGSVSTSSIRLNRNGVGSETVPFSSQSVEYVELLVANASRRSSCWRNTLFACQGRPLDDGVRTVFSAKSFRS